MARKRKSTHSGLSVHWPVLSSSALPLSRSYRAFSTLRPARRHQGLGVKPRQCRFFTTAPKTRLHFQSHLILRLSSGLMSGRHIKLRKKSQAFWLNSLATATASGSGIAVCWTASRRIMQSAATYASKSRSLQDRCIAKGNRPRRSGLPSF